MPIFRCGVALICQPVFLVHRQTAEVRVAVEGTILGLPAVIAKGRHELVEAVALVDFHDVPEHGTAADFHHRLGFDLRFFGNAGCPVRHRE